MRIAGGGRPLRNRSLLAVQVGWMRNLGKHSAVGGDVMAGLTGGRGLVAVRPRYRRWLSPRMSVDVGVGPVVAPSFGASAEVSLSVADLVALTSELAVLDQGGNSTTTWYVGAKTGSYAGLATYAAGAVAGVLYIASVLRH